MAEIHVEFDRRMGPERTPRKYNFIENLLAGSSSQVAPLDMEGQVDEDEDDDDDDDHIILEIKERCGAGSIFGQYGSFIRVNNPFLSLAEELDVSQIEYPGNSSALKRSIPEYMVLDKYQVGKEIISLEFYDLHKISEDYGEEELISGATNPIDRGAVGLVLPPVQ